MLLRRRRRSNRDPTIAEDTKTRRKRTSLRGKPRVVIICISYKLIDTHNSINTGEYEHSDYRNEEYVEYAEEGEFAEGCDPEQQ